MMIALNRHKALLRGFTGVFTCLFIIVTMVRVYAMGTYQGKVDELLGTNSGAVEHSENLADYEYQSDYDSPEALMEAEQVLNERIEEEGAVLLKGTAEDLAVGGDLNVSLFGIRSFRMHYNGAIGGVTNTSLAVRLDKALEERGFHVNEDLIQFYQGKVAEYNTQSTTSVNEVPVAAYKEAGLTSYNGYQDAAIVVLGRTSSEAYTYLPGSAGIENPDEFSESPTGNILGLSDDERDLVHYVEEQGFSKVIVLLNSAEAMEIEELRQDEDVDAILLIGNPGAYGTYGVADLLSGDAVPSGHLVDTYAVNSAVAPSAVNYDSYEYANSDAVYSAWYEVESEGIYTGYRYYETRYYDAIMGNGSASVAGKNETADGSDLWDYDKEVSYSFGYGVEGSTFSEEITDTAIDWSGESDSTVTVRVTNTGDTAAKHVTQLYVSVPYTDYDQRNGVEKSAIQLVGYNKTGEAAEQGIADVVLLAPGESEELAITFNVSDLASYDSNYSHDDTQGAYVLERGDYYFATGNGAHDAVNAVLLAQGATAPEGKELTTTGAVYTETLDKEAAFTVGSDGETLIENQLEDMDINYADYGTAFTSRGASYLTRFNWAESFPATVLDVTANDAMLLPLNCETYDAEAANENYEGTVYTEADFGKEDQIAAHTVLDIRDAEDYDDPAYEEVLSGIPLEDYSSYVCGNNTAIPEIALEHGNAADSPCGMIVGYGMYNDARPPYTVEEGEDSVRGVAPSVYVGAPVMAATYSHLLATAEGNLIGNDGLWIGCYWWFGPGLNLHRSPYNARNNEYYSEDPILTGRMAVDVIKACQAKGVVVCAKHFAFNDIEKNRTGVGVFTTEQAARENELRGFQLAIRDGGMRSIMTGFNRVGTTFSSAHSGLITGLLRGEWGFQGLVITDSVKDKSYMRVAECLVAGTDFMLGGSGKATEAWSAVSAENLLDDAVLTAAARESMHHYLYTFSQSALYDGYGENATVGQATWWATALEVGSYIIATLALLTFIGWIAGEVSGRKERQYEEL